jgi:hypothetical protein
VVSRVLIAPVAPYAVTWTAVANSQLLARRSVVKPDGTARTAEAEMARAVSLKVKPFILA